MQAALVYVEEARQEREGREKKKMERRKPKGTYFGGSIKNDPGPDPVPLLMLSAWTVNSAFLRNLMFLKIAFQKLLY